MTPFATLSGVAAPLPVANVDTDRIIPAQFLKTTSRKGLGVGLFHGWRQDPGFVLNRPPWNRAVMIVALDNFGCGSSREHAPWALTDFGIRCIMAPSIADIFYANCLRNGILPIRLPRPDIDLLMVAADNAEAFQVDLREQKIQAGAGTVHHFDIEPSAKEALISGQDEIVDSERYLPEVERFERSRKTAQNWRTSIPAITFQDVAKRH